MDLGERPYGVTEESIGPVVESAIPPKRPSPAPRHGASGRGSAAFALLSLALASGGLGPIAGPTGRLAAAACASFAGLSILMALPRRHAWRGVRVAGPVLFTGCALLGITRAPLPEGPTLATALLLAVVSIMAAGLGPGPRLRMRAAATAGLALTLYEIAIHRSAWLWLASDGLARGLSGRLAGALGSQTSLGPSVAALPLLFMLAAYLGSLLRRAPRGGPRALVVMLTAWLMLLFAAGWSLGVPLVLRLLLWIGRAAAFHPADMPIPSYPASLAVFLPLVLFVLGLGIVIAAPAEERASSQAPFRQRGFGWAASGKEGSAGAGLLLAAALLLGIVCAPWLRLPARGDGLKVSLLDSGMVGWDVPGHGVYGLESAGMFGLLPRALKAAGFETVVGKEVLSAQALAGTDVVTIINPKEPFPEDVRERLERFVRGGGGLVIMGDHTDLEGIMGPLNELLEPYEVAFRFDSAFTPRHWVNDAAFRPGPLTRLLDDSNNRFQQSTGASLRLWGGADPAAMARWGFSDAGDRANKDNAFLGNYIYEASEPLGDLVVVAMRRHGKGRVLVFGDTSAFQNNATPHAWPFVTRVFQTAAARPIAAVEAVAPWALAVWLAIGMGLLAAGRLRVTALYLAGSLAGHAAAAALFVSALEPRIVPIDPALALVDAAHVNGVSSEMWDDQALTGLNLNLARNGYLALTQRHDAGEWLDQARVLISVFPRRPHPSRELDHLVRWMEAGGEMILAVGWEELEPARPLLERAGLGIAPIPLGPVPVLMKITDAELFQRLQIEPHFARAWPITGVDPGHDKVLYAENDRPLVVRRAMGRGGLTLIADPLFLRNKTLEEEGAAWQGNIAFVRRILPSLDSRAMSGGGQP